MRKLLFLMDPEWAHNFATRILIYAANYCPFVLVWISASRRLQSLPSVRAFDLDFRNELGLAAGFDKNAELIRAMALMGFGFVEIGTVTLKEQSGNPRPRLFRQPSENSLYNRMGFNNRGADYVLDKLTKVKNDLPPNFRVGVNIGLNKDAPHSRVAEDYATLARMFSSVADYLVVNVSSPNTPGLRDLQTKEKLVEIFRAIQDALASSQIPVLLKLAPELEAAQLESIVTALDGEALVQGLILTNTLATEHEGVAVGKSGEALKTVSRQRLEDLRAFSEIDCISVGGIFSSLEMRNRLKLGAQLTQVYTAWVYLGPRMVSNWLRS